MTEAIERKTDFNDFAIAVSKAFEDVSTILSNKNKSIELCEAKKILVLLEDDLSKVILLSSLETSTFEQLLESTRIDPLTLDECLDNMHHFGLLEKYFVKGSPYQPRYKTTKFAKIVLRDLFDVKKEKAAEELKKLQKKQ